MNEAERTIKEIKCVECMDCGTRYPLGDKDGIVTKEMVLSCKCPECGSEDCTFIVKDMQ